MRVGDYVRISVVPVDRRMRRVTGPLNEKQPIGRVAAINTENPMTMVTVRYSDGRESQWSAEYLQVVDPTTLLGRLDGVIDIDDSDE
jgi:hypothetical protein